MLSFNTCISQRLFILLLTRTFVEVRLLDLYIAVQLLDMYILDIHSADMYIVAVHLFIVYLVEYTGCVHLFAI